MLVIHRQTQVDHGRFIVSYEWLCGNPVSRYRELYDRLGLAWNPRTERKVRSTNADGDNQVYSLNRPAARQVDGWKERVKPDEIEACRRFVEPFGLPYYRDFEPYMDSFSGTEPLIHRD